MQMLSTESATDCTFTFKISEVKIMSLRDIPYWRAVCSQFRTLPPGSWWAPGDAIISRLWGIASCSRLQPSSTGPCPVTLRVTWLTTFSSLPMPTSDNCVLPTLEHSLLVGCAAVLETGSLPPQNHKSGAVCRPISDYVGCHTASSGGTLKTLLFGHEATAQCKLF